MNQKTIWDNLARPFFALAPMEDVTDTVFRQIVARAGKPELLFTEFANVDGLCSRGRPRVEHRIARHDAEGPVIAQIWGLNPHNFYIVAKELSQRGFAGIDLNMGCPERSVVKRGACSGLINNPSLAIELIQATREGAGPLPMSVKTRCGLSHWVTEEWAGILLQQNLPALTIHGRIAKEMSHFPARWEEIAKVVRLRDQIAPHTKIIGNGDVTSRADGLAKAKNYGVDGLMVGRGIFTDPWLFTGNPTHSVHDRIQLWLEHVTLYEQTWGRTKNFEAMKKFYKMYTYGLTDASALRAQVMALHSAAETAEFLEQLLKDERQLQRLEPQPLAAA